MWFLEIILPLAAAWAGVFIIAEIRGAREEAELKKKWDEARRGGRSPRREG